MPIKKILILDTGKEWGGGSNSLLELLKRVDKERYHFTALFYHNYKKGDVTDIKNEIEMLGIDFILLKQKRQGIAVKLLKELSRLLFFFNKKLRKYFIFRLDLLFRINKNAAAIEKIINNLNIDLLYMNNQPSSNLEGLIASEACGVKVLQHSRIETTLNDFEIKTANRQLSKMISVSKGVKDSFIRQGIDPLKCIVVYNGIDTATESQITAEEIRSRYNIGKEDLLVGTVGSLMKRKRIKDLLEAAVLITQKSPKQVKFIIVGDGPEKENLFDQVLKRGPRGSIIFTGFQTDAISFINAMDIFVMPSEKEGFPRVILEAMLMGKPVVASDTVGVNELVVDSNTGFLVTLKTPHLFADALLRLIEDSELRIKMGEAGKKVINEDYSIDRYIEGVEKVFEEVFSN